MRREEGGSTWKVWGTMDSLQQSEWLLEFIWGQNLRCHGQLTAEWLGLGIYMGTKFEVPWTAYSRVNGSRNLCGDKVSQNYVEWHLYSSCNNTQPQKVLQKSDYLNDNYNCMKEIPHAMTTPLLSEDHQSHLVHLCPTSVSDFQTSVWATWRGVVLHGIIPMSLLIVVLCRVWNLEFIVSHIVIVTVDESEHCNSILRGSWIIQACNL
jgi:hypothetical protein